MKIKGLSFSGYCRCKLTWIVRGKARAHQIRMSLRVTYLFHSMWIVESNLWFQIMIDQPLWLPHNVKFDMSKRAQKHRSTRTFPFKNKSRKGPREYFSIFVCRWILTFINHMLQWLFIKFIFHSVPKPMPMPTVGCACACSIINF